MVHQESGDFMAWMVGQSMVCQIHSKLVYKSRLVLNFRVLAGV